jgi:hypothetical protein
LRKCKKGGQRFAPVPRALAAVGGPGPGKLRCVVISDTHGLHRDVAVPKGDLLFHCGDFTDTGMPNQVGYNFIENLAFRPKPHVLR